MASPSTVFTELVTTTDRSWGSKVTDNVSDHNGLLFRMKQKGNIKSESGGYEIAEKFDNAYWTKFGSMLRNHLKAKGFSGQSGARRINGREVEIGSFLSEEERLAVYGELKDCLLRTTKENGPH